MITKVASLSVGLALCPFMSLADVVDGRSYMARCEMSLNVPMWRDTGEGCISAEMLTTPASSKARYPLPRI